MKILPLAKNPGIYSCNAYMVLGDWNRIDDANTLIDIGSDGYVLYGISALSTGVGKRRVEKVIFTHSHFDHAAGLKAVEKAFHPEVLAFNKFAGVSKVLIHGQLVKCGDEYFEVIHVPGHSMIRSVCIVRAEGFCFPAIRRCKSNRRAALMPRNLRLRWKIWLHGRWRSFTPDMAKLFGPVRGN